MKMTKTCCWKYQVKQTEKQGIYNTNRNLIKQKKKKAYMGIQAENKSQEQTDKVDGQTGQHIDRNRHPHMKKTEHDS